MFGVIAAIASLTLGQATPVPSYRQASNIAIITIDGVVDSVTTQSFKRRLAEAMDADAIVIDLNTPGGDLMATLQICYELKTNAPQNTVAWIHPHAFSAGTIIALACREIVVAPGSTFGDAAPINATGMPIPATERAKIESPVLTEVIDSARRNHYDERLVEAFVSVGVELWLLKHQTTGETICVNAIEYQTIFGTEPPRNFTPIGVPDQNISPLSPLFDTFPQLTQGLRSQPATWDPTFTQQLPPSRMTLSREDAIHWNLVRQIVPNDRLLTLKPALAMQYGLIADVIADDAALQRWFGATSMHRLYPTWSEGLVRVLVSWPIRLTLIALFLVCVFVELATGTTGLFSAGAVVAMGILIGAPWLAGLSDWWDILLVLLGIVLIAIEVFVIPGTGFTGFAGVGCLFVGMIGSFISGDLGSAAGQSQLLTGIGTVLGGCLVAIIASWFIVKHLGGASAMQKLVLSGEVHGRATTRNAPPNLNVTAVAITDLRPSGRIQIDDRIYDATTTGGWISSGAVVRIMHTGLTIKVEEFDS